MRIFKNKFFITLLCIAVVITIFSAVFSVMGVNDTVKNITSNMLAPVQKGLTSIKSSLEGYAMYFKGMDKLIEENNQLKDEISSLKEKLNDSKLSKEENERLRQYLDLKEAHEDFELMEALIIGSESDNYMSVIRINRGKGNGISVGMPVVTSAGLVGSICEVGDTWADVRVITEASSGVGGYISRSGEIGIVKGDITYKGSGVCKLEYLDEDADVKIGDLVYTSGAGSVYPGGLLIGKVSSIGINEYNRTKTATVECTVDFNSMKYVMIVTDFDVYSTYAGE